MASDRFVYWKSKDKRPTQQQIGVCLEDYVKNIATSVKWDGDRFFVVLPGNNSFPFKRVDASLGNMVDETRGRWFEVWIDEDCIDVITRQHDEFTNVVATGFAELCARFWHGKLER